MTSLLCSEPSLASHQASGPFSGLQSLCLTYIPKSTWSSFLLKAPVLVFPNMTGSCSSASSGTAWPSPWASSASPAIRQVPLRAQFFPGCPTSVHPPSLCLLSLTWRTWESVLRRDAFWVWWGHWSRRRRDFLGGWGEDIYLKPFSAGVRAKFWSLGQNWPTTGFFFG